MINVESSERASLICRYTSQYSNRRTYVFSYHYDEIVVFVSSQKTLLSFRKCFCHNEVLHSERRTLMLACLIKTSTSRVMMFSGAISNNERTCMLKVDARFFVHAAPLFSSLRYVSDRHTRVQTDPISQRRIMFSVLGYSERGSFVCRLNRTYLFNAIANTTIKYISDRSVYLQLQQTYDIRSISLVYGIYSNRYTLAITAQRVYVHSPVALLTLANVYSNRTIAFRSESTYSERAVSLAIIPFSERFTFLALRIYSDRSVSIAVYASYAMHVTVMQQARPETSERKCMSRTYDNHTTRMIYLETRELYSTKRPYILNDTAKTVISSLDDSTNVSVISDRELILNSSAMLNTEITNNVYSSKIVFSSIEAAYSVSIIDNTGASVSINNETRVKTLLSANIMCLEIEFI